MILKMQQLILIIVLILFQINNQVESLNEINQQVESSNEIDCFSIIFKLTQACSNMDLIYYHVPLFKNQGFASEFNLNYVYALLNAIMENKRLIVGHNRKLMKRDWEYQCKPEQDWFCFFKKDCDDSYINDTSLIENNNIKVVTFHSLIRDPKLIIENINDKLKTISMLNKEDKSCELNEFSSMKIASLASSYLYTFNDVFKNKLEDYHVKFYGDLYSYLEKTKYLSIQLRTNDKIVESLDETFAVITDAKKLYSLIENKLFPIGTIKDVFIASDNCTIACELRNVLRRYNINSFGRCVTKQTCLNSDVLNPRLEQDNIKKNKLLFSDIELLKNGEYFVGDFCSNIVRLIYKLRYNTRYQHNMIPIDHKIIDKVRDNSFDLQTYDYNCKHFKMSLITRT
jgi:hypothetical protein